VVAGVVGVRIVRVSAWHMGVVELSRETASPVVLCPFGAPSLSGDGTRYWVMLAIQHLPL
jgi:hypothetical protein